MNKLFLMNFLQIKYLMYFFALPLPYNLLNIFIKWFRVESMKFPLMNGFGGGYAEGGMSTCCTTTIEKGPFFVNTQDTFRIVTLLNVFSFVQCQSKSR